MKYILTLALVLTLMGISSSMVAQTTVTAQAFAEVVSTLTAQETNPLTFGRFSPQVNGGRITVHPNGSYINEGSVVLNQSSLKPGTFFITGEPQTAFSIQLPTKATMLLHENGESSMKVDGWVSDPPANTGAVIQLDGSQMVKIGAELQIGNMETNPTGIYSGSFELVFAYN